MEIFSLFGTILIKTSDAIESISKVTNTAADMTNKIADSVTKAGKEISGIGTKLSAQVTAPIMALGAASVKTFSSFEESMANVQAVTGASSDTMKKLENTARGMAKETVYSASECADALYYMGLAGWNAEEMTDGLPAVLNLAAAAQMDLGRASDIVTDYLTAFGLNAKDAEGFVDQLAYAMSRSNTDVDQLGEAYKNVAATSTQLGYSLEDTTAALMVMANSGIKGGEAGTALSSIMTRLGNNVSNCRDELGKYGIEVYDSQGNVKSLSSILTDMQSVWKGLSDEQKSNLSYIVAGKTAQAELMTVMGESTGAFEQYRQGLLGCNDAAKEMVNIQNETLSAQLKILKSRFEELCITIGERLAPYIEIIADKIGDLCDWFSNLSDEQLDQILKWAAIVAAIGPVLVVVGKVITIVGSVISIGGKLVSGIATVISVIGKASSVFAALGGVLASVGTFISGTLIPAIASIGAPVLAVIAVVTALIAVGVLLYKNWDTIKEKATELADKASEKFNELRDNAKKAWDNMTENAKEKWDDLKASVKKASEDLYDNTIGKLKELRDGVKEKFSETKEQAADKFKDLKERWTEKFDETRDKMKQSVEEMKENVTSRFEQLRDDGKRISEETAKGIQEKWKEAKDNISTWIKGTADNAIGSFDDMKTRALASVESIRSGAAEKFTEIGGIIQEKFGAVSDKIEGAFNKARDSVKEIVDGIKTMFTFEWKLPDIKLPHFDIKWNTQGKVADLFRKVGLQGIPSIDVEWYADGGIMTRPTEFGYNPYTGKTMVGGENGAEAIAPISLLKEYIKEAMDERGSGDDATMDEILRLLSAYLPMLVNVLSNLRLSMNDREFARLVKAVD